MYKKHKKLLKGLIIYLVAVFYIEVFGVVELKAATHDYVATKVVLDETMVGRYRLNYTGNTNYFDVWHTDGTLISGVTYNDAGNYINSSTATLSPQTISSTITKAYLVWDARATAFENKTTTPTQSVRFKTPTGGIYNISPTYSISDNRNLGESGRNYAHYYCMATDVTDIVKRSGFGNYSVCNIPRWNSSWTYKDWKGEYPGGDSVGAWQLVIIEESKDFSVRAVSLSIASEFHLATDFTGSLNLGSGLKSKTSGSTNGQFLFAAVRSGSGAAMTEMITTKNSSGTPITNVVGNAMSHPGLFKNGQLVNNRDYATGGMCVDLSEVSNIGNSIVAVDLAVQNTSWTTFNMLGISVDIAYPDFVGTQTTTVNNSTSATVTGQFINTAVTPDTGIYNGNLTVNIDSGLTPISATAVVNGTITVNGTISGNSVSFNGSAVVSMMNGSSISYAIQCSTGNSGKTVFYNSAGFHGYLRSDGVNTGYWINEMWTAKSSAAAKYKVIINQGTGIETVTGSGEYACGTTVKPTAALKPGYHWSSWTGSYTTPWQDFNFQMPAEDITLTANAEVNSYTIIFHPNDGGQVTHIDNIETHYDADVTLPNGADFYQKYTLDGVNVTNEVLSGELTLTDVEAESDALDDEEAAALAEGEVDAEKAQDRAAEGTEKAEGTGSEATTSDETEPKPGNDTEQSVAESEETEKGALLQAEPASVQKVYPSVFMGWSLEDEKNSFIPKWKVGDVVKNLTEENNSMITLYAVWDDCPWIQAENLYYTLEQAQSGYITQEEILSHATASDREDGSPINPGFHENGTSFSIPDYSPADFTQFQHEGSVTETFKVTDSIGNTYQKTITVYVVDTTAVAVKPEGTTRFIDEKYFNESYENGGLEENSIWKTDPEYNSVLQSAFDNLKNDTPEQTYHFSHEDILEMKKFIEQNGIGNTKSDDALTRFYNQFME